jgi:hypothetical protein
MNGQPVAPKPRVARRRAGEFAEETRVPIAKTREEIEAMVLRSGGGHYSTYNHDDKAAIMFEIGSRRIRLILPLPLPSDHAFNEYGLGGKSKYNSRDTTPAERERKWDQAKRQRWRALYLVLKAKLEAVAVGIATLEDEFLAYTVLPSQQTVGEWVNPQVDEVYETGVMPPMLPGLPVESALRALPGAR